MDDPRIGRVLDDRYRICERLAAGGMGIVYRAERLGLAKPVAVKFLHRSSATMSEHRERFDREAAAMSRLTHPNLVSVIDFGSADDVPYLVMEYHPGVSLAQRLEPGALTPARAVSVAYQMLAGLGSAHAAGVVHRDLKPDNVLLVEGPGQDFVKILDFGVAKLLDTGEGPSELSAMANRALGTPHYMSPEQARAAAIDHRSDLYAVGVILYEMVTGRRPFDGEGDLAVLRMQVEDEPTPPHALASTISRELDQVILRALEKAPARRWQSAADFGAALAALPEGSGVTTPGGAPRATTAHTEADHNRPTVKVDRQELAGLREASRPDGPRRRRRSRVPALLVLLVLTAAAAVVAIARGWVDVPVPAWSPWQPAEPGDAITARPAPPAAPAPAVQVAPDAAPPAPAAVDAGAPRDAGTNAPTDAAHATDAGVLDVLDPPPAEPL